MLYRISILILNFLFPPLAVLLLTGPNFDFALNCVLLLLAVIPSHVHGFLISTTFFHRRSKVKKGQYPGDPIPLITSEYVTNGGATTREVVLLKNAEGRKRRRSSRR
ncbi:uncharacterized protein LTR77_004101 [Saxophila tyrrhenica]|uniref:Plasma membrane proteolipid 3 n=1 Tax=Saxophila tyrrhenica TaxID=1690608 RepID=A0AAV9PBU7_9PEZI|nr:hypothetical protein LTR77_004101 [Saxophila tyrrhenica]